MKTRVVSAVLNVEEIIDGIVSASGNGGIIFFPKKFFGRKVKVLVLKEEVDNITTAIKKHEGPCSIRIFKDGVEVKLEDLSMSMKSIQTEFKNYETAKKFVSLYNKFYPNYEFRIV